MKKINLVQLGCGNVGTALLKLYSKKRTWLAERDIGLNPVALVKSSGVIFNGSGLQLENLLNYKYLLDNFIAYNGWDSIFQQLKTLDQPYILVDATAADIGNIYMDVLENGNMVVTSNKVVLAGNLASYQALMEYRNWIGYEATVCSGTPVIGPLRVLLNAGHEIIKIEAVLSGTLAYICNRLKNQPTGYKLSEAIQDAKEKQLTEPDPRDDLRGIDTLRKAIILARAIGWNFDSRDAEVSLPVSEKYFEAGEGLEIFLGRLPSLDLEKLPGNIDKALPFHYVAEITSGGIKIQLRNYSPAHPFAYNWSSGNMIILDLKKEDPLPIVINGPGAGADFTAQAVLGDIVTLVQKNM